MPFTHLHVHTHYSLLDGACRISDLVKKAKSYGMDSLAITDHGCMYGVIEFFNECKKEGIKPIVGMEAYMAPGDRRERSTPGGNAGEAAFHMVLLAQNAEGYKNLIKLSSIAYREGFYYKPRIDKEVLREYSSGLIATSACLGGEIPSAFMKRDAKAARKVAETYLEIFGPDRFFIEVQKQGIREQDMVNPELAELAKKVGCGIVGTNDVHFLNKDDHFAHDVLCCISMGRLVSDEGRMKYPTALYLKSPEEMAEALKEFPEAIDNTARIAGMCDLQLDFSKRYAPVYRVPKEKFVDAPVAPVGGALAHHGSGESDDQRAEARPTQSTSPAKTAITIPDDERYLRQLCEQGLDWRYGTRAVSTEIRSRLDKELSVIAAKNFCSYFLIVWDFCNFARENGIPVGARGSGVGTMVGYLLGLCNVDPLKYGLLFERFMDPSRNEMPDIDIDICQNGRQKVIDYVRNKYGHVAQIITFGTLAAKAVCKDVGRVMGMPLAEVDKITKLIPGVPGMTLDKALAQNPELSDLYNANAQARQIIDIGKRLEGLCRNAGVHAAGVIIADQPLDGVIPLCKDKEDNVLTQFEGPISEKCGLLKMDFLGLRTLSTLTRSIELEAQTRPLRPAPWSPQQPTPPLEQGRIDIEKVEFVDKNVLALFCRGETKGIFQFESGGMQDLLMKMQPDRLEDLIAANALYRPGPMELIPLYCNRKNGREQSPLIHPIMDQILAETYAIMVYQEQVMQIFNQLGGIELSAAYKLIKAISKKTVDVIAKFQPEFIKGAISKGVARDQAQDIFDLILKFGGYGFNKSHSSRYAIIAFQTAYMKTYHPVEYMAALLTFEMGSTEKVVEYIEECRRLTLPDGTKGIQVLPPDVNISDKDFTPVYVDSPDPAGGEKKKKKSAKAKPATKAGVIRFGMMAVRGVGEKAVEAIVEERTARGPFTSLYDFCERVDLRTVTRSTIDALVKCGAFSSMGRRSQLLQVLDGAVESGQRSQQDKRAGQINLFGGGGAESTMSSISPGLPDVDELPDAELLKFEKELLGFYITSHPLTEHQSAMEQFSTASTREATACSEGTEVTVGGMITRIKKVITKNGRSAGMPMAIITLEDLEGQIDGTMFADTFADVTIKSPGVVAAESVVFVRGKVDRKRETPSLLINEVISIADAPGKLTTAVAIKLDPTRHTPEVVAELEALLKRHKGNTEVFVQLSFGPGAVQAETEQKVVLRLDRERWVRPGRALSDDLELLLGPGSVQLCGLGSRRRKRVQQQALFKEAEAPVETELLAAGAGTPDEMESGSLELESSEL